MHFVARLIELAAGPILIVSNPRTHVYIDGFNLYYGCLRGTAYKWLDLSRFCRLLLPQNDVRRVVYCTAKIQQRGTGPGAARRQATYLDALQAQSGVDVVLGHFLTQTVKMPNADGSGFSTVLKTEEKGSDVNLASHLLADAFTGECDVAVVVTNDSDLVTPIKIVKERLGLPVGIVFPLRPGRRASKQLGTNATFKRSIRSSLLARAQFPVTVVTASGRRLTKPNAW